MRVCVESGGERDRRRRTLVVPEAEHIYFRASGPHSRIVCIMRPPCLIHQISSNIQNSVNSNWFRACLCVGNRCH